jgi:hypothetical protein
LHYYTELVLLVAAGWDAEEQKLDLKLLLML